MIDIKTTQFSGPLDLLLNLIEEKEFAITELSICEVTGQYLEYLESLEHEYEAEQMSDFLVVASRLLVMKSRQLLPQFFPEEEDEESLAKQLKLYKQFIEASKVLNARYESSNRSFFRTEPIRKAEGFVPPENVEANAMEAVMQKILKQLVPLKPLPKVFIDKSIRISDKIAELKKVFRKMKQISFREMLHSKENKTEVIVSFLALLELVKQKSVSLAQEENYGDIIVTRS